MLKPSLGTGKRKSEALGRVSRRLGGLLESAPHPLVSDCHESRVVGTIGEESFYRSRAAVAGHLTRKRLLGSTALMST